MSEQGRTIIPGEHIQQAIHVIRGHRILLDSDLAGLYGVETKALNLAVKRNTQRFPADFMFQLTKQEYESLRLQIETSNGRGGRRYNPYAFTEQGVAMLSSVLRSERAIQVNIEIMRAFVRMRQFMVVNRELARKLGELESKVQTHDKHILALFEAIRLLMAPPVKTENKEPFGFHSKKKKLPGEQTRKGARIKQGK